MAPPHELLVALATYNERENLPDLVRRVWEVLPSADILVVDDNSPDGTGHWVLEAESHEPRLRSLHRPRKMGLGSATVAALKYSCYEGYKFVATLDADGSHDPAEIPHMLALLTSAREDAPDVIIGSRYVPGGTTVGWPLYRRWMSRSINAFARRMLGLPVKDCSGAFRCLRVALLAQVDLATIRSQGYACLEEILWRFKQAGARFAEIPIVFANRQRGRSKINLRESLAAIAMLTRLGLRNWLGRP
jgi:dolichol-phosphate mannosyltransferase